jgi:hypothetical protein
MLWIKMQLRGSASQMDPKSSQSGRLLHYKDKKYGLSIYVTLVAVENNQAMKPK